MPLPILSGAEQVLASVEDEWNEWRRAQWRTKLAAVNQEFTALEHDRVFNNRRAELSSQIIAYASKLRISIAQARAISA